MLTTVTPEPNQNSKSHLAHITGVFQITCLVLAAMVVEPASYDAEVEKGNVSVGVFVTNSKLLEAHLSDGRLSLSSAGEQRTRSGQSLAQGG